MNAFLYHLVDSSHSPQYLLSSQRFLNVLSHPCPLQMQSWSSHMVTGKLFPFLLLLLLRMSSPASEKLQPSLALPTLSYPLSSSTSLHRMTKHPCLTRTEGFPGTWDFRCQNLENPGQNRWAGHPLNASLLASLHRDPGLGRRKEQGCGMGRTVCALNRNPQPRRQVEGIWPLPWCPGGRHLFLNCLPETVHLSSMQKGVIQASDCGEKKCH